MGQAYALVVTTINYPTFAIKEIARRKQELPADFFLIGDSKSPPDFVLDGAHYFDIDAQYATGLAFAKACPTRHYARKNVGYLAAIQSGADVIIETDDDNIPLDQFYAPRRRYSPADRVTVPGWCNAYNYFTDAQIWPRGFPLNHIRSHSPPLEQAPLGGSDCPIQQGLADNNPDVDAIFRLVLALPLKFEPEREVVLGKGVWCPFNSQNTTWWKDAFPLLYLPYHCSFRMTDIWRSFVAQRIAWENDWNLLFHSPTVYQDRNEHDLLVDFADEVPGYLHNHKIKCALEALPLKRGVEFLTDNLIDCYNCLIKIGVVGKEEEKLLEAWVFDLGVLRRK